MATGTTKSEHPLQDLIRQLEDTAKEAGDRISEYLAETGVRQRLADAADAVNDFRLAVLARIRGEQVAKPAEKRRARAAKPRKTTARAVKPLEELTVRELQKLASERRIPGRSSMSKAELVDALRQD